MNVWHFIYRPESNRHSPAGGTHDGFYAASFPPGTTLAVALDFMHRVTGVPRGSARGGIVEVQTDDGIHSMPGNTRRLDPAKAMFRTWAQLEAEEANESR